jgi:hypothetical protein
MIGKRVKASKVKSAAAHAGNLVDYISNNKDGKVFHSGGIGFITNNPAGQKLEMMALASSNPRSQNPITHYIVSWKENERPSSDQIDRAVQIILEEMGMNAHQAIYCAHRDTKNIHVHIAVNRIHPDTNRAIEINKGFDLDPLHRAIAKIEHLQGWQPEPKARYLVLENGEILEVNANRKQQRQPQQRAADFEQRTGEKSAQRIGIEQIAPLIQQANTWQQIHHQLAQLGAKYEPKGTGAIIRIGETVIKASSVDRAASMASLQKRIGIYEPPLENLEIAPRKPEQLATEMPSGWLEYNQQRMQYYTAKNADADSFRQKCDDQNRQLVQQQQQQREELLTGKWKGKGDLLNALRSVLAKEQKEARTSLQQQQDLERQNLREKYQPFPSFEDWQRLRGRPDLAEQWRYRHGSPSPNLVVRVSAQEEKIQQERGRGLSL